MGYSLPRIGRKLWMLFICFTENALHNVSSEALIQTFYICRSQWYRRKGCRCTPKSFDLSKIREKYLKICAKSLKIREKSLNILAKSRQKWHPSLFDFKRWRPTFAEIQVKTFFGRHTKKRSSWSLWENICSQKSHNNVSGKFGENPGKYPSHPQTCACSYNYGRSS